jgi:predicted unusual protein kinase regulating ubiquinone biosynthesis (AarF/ABC1/UbiB family)
LQLTHPHDGVHRGLTLTEFKKRPLEEKRKAAEALTTFMATNFRTGIINTDTHAGNFIFCPGGKVGFIDFGRTIQAETKGLDVLLKTVIQKDENAAMNEEMTPFPFNEIWALFLPQQAHLHAGDFQFTREYIAKVMDEGKRFPYRNQMQISMEAAWSMTTSMGLWNIFADLEVPVNYGQICLEVLGAERNSA